tara:strand:- start:226 stop:612 length:387 start_codon:yes stop_codon:yes gene_type:complete
MEQKNILIIEDDPRVRKSIGEMFSESCKVEYAENGTEGLFKMTYNKYDLIITDLHMPNMNGVEMLELRSKKRPYDEKTPIIMCTTECDTQLKKRGLGAGVGYWLIKPFNILRLYQLVEKIISRRETLY